MDEREARRVLGEQLRRYRAWSYAELQELLGRPDVFEATGPSGARYQLEVQAFWDDRPGGNLRVLASIDDGGPRALAPMSDDFILAPDGRYIGE